MNDQEVATLIANMRIEKLESRDEQEVAGYFEVLKLIIEDFTNIPLTENYIKGLHKQLLRYSDKDVAHRGDYKRHPNFVVGTLPSGEQKTIFKTTDVYQTPFRMQQAVKDYHRMMDAGETHPLIVIGAFIYEFLSIHPFQDGNGRLSRLLTNMLLLQNGYDFIQYASLEHEMEAQKPDYYRSLMSAQRYRDTDREEIDRWLSFFFRAIQRVISKVQRSERQIMEEPAALYLNDRQQRVMQYVEENGKLSIRELSTFFLSETSRNTVKYDLKRLTDAGFLKRLGKGRGTVYALNR